MKRVFGIVLGLIIAFGCAGCDVNTREKTNKIQIIATLFPQYDFAREIAGDKAEVTLLAPAGADGHTYEPTPTEIIKISQSDMFIYTGKYMEGWAQRIIDSVSSENLKVVDVSEGINLKHANHHHGDHKENYDSHIWTNPLYAKTMVDNILAALCEIDSENSDYYKQRANNYKNELDNLDKMFEEVVNTAKIKKMVFGDSFAFLYFVDRYGLQYEAAYDTCSSEAEPGALVITRLIEDIKENKISVVYYSETSNKKVAESIAQETGANTLLFHSCHTVTASELNNGTGYLELMRQNLENLKKGLN